MRTTVRRGEVTEAGRIHRHDRHDAFVAYGIRERRGAVHEYGPFVFGGALLIAAFAFAGYYMGQSAVAHNAIPDDAMELVISPATNLVSKGSLLPDASFDIVNANQLLRKLTVTDSLKGSLVPRKQIVSNSGKGDFVDNDPGQAVRIIPASVNFKDEPEPVVKRLVKAPPAAKIEETFKLKRGDKQKVVAQRRLRLAEENCLARAIYFEARSESELGQLAVAKVILNRTKNPDYPKTICGVVYQGSGRRNSCQFSFACDGLADDVRQPAAWTRSKKVAQMAIEGDHKVRVIGAATNYHADYVRPKWAKNMKRLIKIGRHIFYSDT